MKTKVQNWAGLKLKSKSLLYEMMKSTVGINGICQP